MTDEQKIAEFRYTLDHADIRRCISERDFDDTVLDDRDIDTLLERIENAWSNTTAGEALETAVDAILGDKIDALKRDCCTGCRMYDPAGTHYADCTLLEEGNYMVPRGTHYGFEPPAEEDWPEYDPDFKPVYRITTAPPRYDGFDTYTVAWLDLRWKGNGPQLRRVAIRKEHLNRQWARYGSGLYAVYDDAEFEAMGQYFFEPISNPVPGK
jgi:hypothetical protein